MRDGTELAVSSMKTEWHCGQCVCGGGGGRNVDVWVEGGRGDAHTDHTAEPAGGHSATSQCPW